MSKYNCAGRHKEPYCFRMFANIIICVKKNNSNPIFFNI
ncbi:MAG: hypothetical protein NT02SARS_1607 [SAR86 cluster bacterium SAR86B]|uniref:Uncharacterized protein n=1 Tax=SAR86 cluster bacterium SAR86B TaxID=1123867 RepID=J4KSR6_9GAMM|nr:MAG: hypothetical protein NT02SARS_1607 [SAR86 cluster bacterium SAR86B]